ncbi:MAG: undecaprenyl-diphosphatase UppP [Chloroflexota bacterium]
MSLLEAIILGIIQGATEFLPVSSSGHSILVPTILGFETPDLNAVVVAHLGTMLAVLIYFFTDIKNIITGTIQGLITRTPMATAESRLGWYIVVGSIPAAIAGLLLEDWFESVFADPRWAALFLIGTAALLVAGERLRSGEKTLEKMGWADAIIIGIFQMFALLPGISRSGSTMVGGLIRGLDRPLAARYSFLMSAPIIFGAGVLQGIEMVSEGGWQSEIGSLAVVFITSAIVGYACIALLIAWLRKRNFYPFAIYCALFGVLFLLFW